MESSAVPEVNVSLTVADLTRPLSPGSLLRILECPVCMEVPLPPIYQCVKGHHVCSTCKPKLKACGLCRGKFSDTRNYAMEQIILSSNHACPFKENGCDVVKSWDSMKVHVKVCLFKPIKCPMLLDSNNRCGCRNMKIDQVRDHLITAHNTTVYPGSNQSTSIVFLSSQIDHESPHIQFAFKPIVLDLNGTNFWATAFRLNHMIYWTVLCLGTKDEAAKYTANIVLEPNKVPSIQWTIPVDPIGLGTEHVYLDPPTSISMFNPSCTIADFKKFAEVGNLMDGTPYYCFVTHYTISVNVL